jgi:phage/plasmid-like protein (TIGR03299 family)
MARDCDLHNHSIPAKRQVLSVMVYAISLLGVTGVCYPACVSRTEVRTTTSRKAYMPTGTVPAANTAFSAGGSMMVVGGVVDEAGRRHYGDSEVVPEGLTTAQAMQHAGLDYEVVQKPIHRADGSVIEGYVQNVRADDPEAVFGIVTPRYQNVQNRDAFEVVEFMAQEGANWVAGGTIDKGRKAWGLLALPGDLTVAGEQIKKNVLFMNCHDGTESITGLTTPIRPQCTNALPFMVRGEDGSGRTIRIRHVGDVTGKLAEAQQIMRTADNYLAKLVEVGDKLADKKVGDKVLKRMLEQLYPAGTSDKQVENAEERRRLVAELMASAPNLEGHHGTGWAFVNAVAEIADWGSNRQRDRMARLCWNMDGKLKDRALAIAAQQFSISLN